MYKGLADGFKQLSREHTEELKNEWITLESTKTRLVITS